MSDEDLIFLTNAGSKLAEMAFYRRYSEYSRHQARIYASCFKNTGITEEEFYAVAFSKTHEAFLRFDRIEKDFYTYWKVMVQHAIYDYVRDNSYQAGGKAFGGTSLDRQRFYNNEVLLLSDTVGEDETTNQVYEFIQALVDGESNLLTKEEKVIADLLLLQEHSRKDICQLTNWPMNKVNYLARKVTRKIQQILKENYL